MEKLKIRTASHPSRCEICHQTDLFDAVSNHCTRCADTVENLLIAIKDPDAIIDKGRIIRGSVAGVMLGIFGGVFGLIEGQLLSAYIYHSFQFNLLFELYDWPITILTIVWSFVLFFVFGSSLELPIKKRHVKAFAKNIGVTGLAAFVMGGIVAWVLALKALNDLNFIDLVIVIFYSSLSSSLICGPILGLLFSIDRFIKEHRPQSPNKKPRH